jgi:hypothetical protein
MFKIFFCAVTGIVTVLGMLACDKGGDEKILKFECEDQFQGEACYKLGKLRTGDEALNYYRIGCERHSSKACIAVAEQTTNKEEGERVLKQACEWKNEEACAKAGKK